MKPTPIKPPNIKKAWLANLWFEDDKGNRSALTENEIRSGKLRGTKRWTMACSCFPSEVVTHYYRRRKDGGYGEKDRNSSASSTANSEDLVLALVLKDRVRLYDAIRIVSQACERCLNVLGYRYKLGWGYRITSKSAKKCNTHCRLCK